MNQMSAKVEPYPLTLCTLACCYINHWLHNDTSPIENETYVVFRRHSTLCFFNKIIVLVSSLSPMTSLTTGSWPGL